MRPIEEIVAAFWLGLYVARDLLRRVAGVGESWLRAIMHPCMLAAAFLLGFGLAFLASFAALYAVCALSLLVSKYV